jgi:hypothetical protein
MTGWGGGGPGSCMLRASRRRVRSRAGRAGVRLLRDAGVERLAGVAGARAALDAVGEEWGPWGGLPARGLAA